MWVWHLLHLKYTYYSNSHPFFYDLSVPNKHSYLNCLCRCIYLHTHFLIIILFFSPLYFFHFRSWIDYPLKYSFFKWFSYQIVIIVRIIALNFHSFKRIFLGSNYSLLFNFLILTSYHLENEVSIFLSFMMGLCMDRYCTCLWIWNGGISHVVKLKSQEQWLTEFFLTTLRSRKKVWEEESKERKFEGKKNGKEWTWTGAEES